MSRPSDIETKAVAARIPMGDYIKLLQEATNKKLSMNELLILKIYAEDKSKDYESKIKALEAQVKEKDKTIKETEAKLEKSLSGQKNTVLDLKKQIDGLEKGRAGDQQAVKQAKNEQSKYAADITKLNNLISIKEKELKNKEAEFIKLKKEFDETNKKIQAVIKENENFIEKNRNFYNLCLKYKNRFLDEVWQGIESLPK